MEKILRVNWFHPHPNLERKLGMDKNHVIIDRDEYEEVLRFLMRKEFTPKMILDENNIYIT